jgi:hypothetical protein
MVVDALPENGLVVLPFAESILPDAAAQTPT